jgi:excisionase family DNA binding protein
MVTIEEAANALHVHAETVRRWARLGRLQAVHVGRRWLIPSGELARILAGGLDGAPSVTGAGPDQDPAEHDQASAPADWLPYQGRPGVTPRIVGERG